MEGREEEVGSGGGVRSGLWLGTQAQGSSRSRYKLRPDPLSPAWPLEGPEAARFAQECDHLGEVPVSSWNREATTPGPSADEAFRVSWGMQEESLGRVEESPGLWQEDSEAVAENLSKLAQIQPFQRFTEGVRWLD